MSEWDGKVDPNDKEYDGKNGPDTRYCGAGKKALVPLGFERWKSSKGSAMLSIMYGCILDLEKGGPDAGAVVWRNFALTQNAVQFFARFARAMGFTTPFNVFSDEDVGAILGKGACVGKVEVETYERRDGKEGHRSEVKFFDPFTGSWEPDFDALVAEMEEKWDEYLAFRAEHPRGAAPTGGGSGGGESGGGGSYSNEDIPF
jgi:hypothetical protein